MNEDGSFKECEINGHVLSGKAYMDYLDEHVRQAYFHPKDYEMPGWNGDIMWYLWLSANSPLFGKDQMTTLERCLIDDKKTHKEHTVPYYKLIERQELAEDLAVQVDDPAVEICVARVRDDHLRAKLLCARERLFQEDARERALVRVARGEPMQLGMPARRAQRDRTVGVDGVDGNLVEPSLEAGDLLGLRAEAELERVEADGDRLVGDGGAIVEAVVVPVCGECESHARAIIPQDRRPRRGPGPKAARSASRG